MPWRGCSVPCGAGASACGRVACWYVWRSAMRQRGSQPLIQRSTESFDDVEAEEAGDKHGHRSKLPPRDVGCLLASPLRQSQNNCSFRVYGLGRLLASPLRQSQNNCSFRVYGLGCLLASPMRQSQSNDSLVLPLTKRLSPAWVATRVLEGCGWHTRARFSQKSQKRASVHLFE